MNLLCGNPKLTVRQLRHTASQELLEHPSLVRRCFQHTPMPPTTRQTSSALRGLVFSRRLQEIRWLHVPAPSPTVVQLFFRAARVAQLGYVAPRPTHQKRTNVGLCLTELYHIGKNKSFLQGSCVFLRNNGRTGVNVHMLACCWCLSADFGLAGWPVCVLIGPNAARSNLFLTAAHQAKACSTNSHQSPSIKNTAGWQFFRQFCRRVPA